VTVDLPIPRVDDFTRFDVTSVRRDFPALDQTVHGYPLAYLDNAATTQKPTAVVDRIARYYTRENSNVHRGVHYLSQQATDAFEQTRSRVADYLGVTAAEIVFTSGTTGAINLVASGLSHTMSEGDEIIISALEHHSNIVPWQLACRHSGATLRVIPVDDNGVLDIEAFKLLLTDRTRLVAVAHTSNAIGSVNPIREMSELAHLAGASVLVDAAQAFAHGPLDARELEADFLCFSGHKMFGPTGIGALYGRRAKLEALPPWQGGGDMIETVTFEKSTYAAVPHRFEAGTPNIAGVLGLGAAVEYLSGLDWGAVRRHEEALMAAATAQLEAIRGLRIVGTAPGKAPVLSFVYEHAHPYDIGVVLDRMGVAVRTGHHCAMPLMKRLDVPGTVRASFALYNTEDDVEALAAGMRKVESLFA
jgi:cysteine desulfurase/selenocysteine lyase